MKYDLIRWYLRAVPQGKIIISTQSNTIRTRVQEISNYYKILFLYLFFIIISFPDVLFVEPNRFIIGNEKFNNSLIENLWTKNCDISLNGWNGWRADTTIVPDANRALVRRDLFNCLGLKI